MSDPDDLNDDEIYDDEDEDIDIDDDDAMSSRRSNLVKPFSGGGFSGSSSRPESGSGSGGRTDLGGSRFSGQSNLPGSRGGSTFGSRPTPTPTSSGGSSGGSTYSPNRPGTTYGGSTRSNLPGSTGPGGSSSSSGSGGSPFSRPQQPGGSSSFGNRPPPGQAPGSTTSPTTQTAPPRGDDRSKNPLSKVTSGLGGLRDKLPGGGGGDKSARPKSEGGGPLSKVTSGLGGLRDKLPGGGGGNKPARPAAPKSGGGGPLSKVTSGLGGLRDRLPGGGGNKPTARPTSSSTSTSAPSSGGGFRPFSGGSSQEQTRPPAPKAAPKKGGGLGGLFGFGRGGEKKPDMHARVERASKAPQVDEPGLTLDNKLDILGVGLLLGSLALFFSSMSPTQGQLTQPVLTALSQLFGWGAIAVPFAMFASGMWLIVRHFGDEAPHIDPVRIAGIGLAYLSVLITFQYIESIQRLYTLALLEEFLRISIDAGRGGGWIGAQLYKLLVLNITELGGVFVVIAMYIISIMFMLRISAAELAVFLISIGRSFAAAQSRRRQERQARARLAAEAARLAETTVSVSKPAAAELGDGKAPAALPGAEPPSLPEPRPIPITKGGKTVTAFFGDDGEVIGVETEDEAEAEARPSLASRLFNAVPLSLPVGGKRDEKDEEAKPAAEKSGGLFGRISAIAGRDTGAERTAEAAAKPEPKPEAAPASSPTPYTPPAASVQTAPPPTAAPPVTSPPSQQEEAPPARLGDLMRQPTASAQPASPYQRPAGSSPFAPRPSAPPAAATPSDEAAAESDEEKAETASPATPKGGMVRPFNSGTFGRPSAPPPAAATSATPSAAGDNADDEGEDAPEEQTTDRNQRLNALRSGYFNRQPPAPANGDPAKPATPAGEQTPPRPTAAAYPSDRFQRPAPKINYTDDSDLRQKAAENDDDAPPARTAPGVSAPPAGSASPSAFRRPEGPPAATPPQPRRVRRQWRLPDYKTLLNPGSENDFDRETLLQRARTIEDTLQSFGAPGRVVEVNTGPVITQFGVEPDYLVTRSGKKNRVKVGAIAQLDKDLQLALGAKSIRIEAPVPGKGYVGIEVPNEEASLVGLRDVMESDTYRRILSKSPLAIALGQSVDGTPISADLGVMPHLLIAGTTGSGKSVLVNAIIISLILSNPPDRVKFIMVDPKRVELTGYNGIPHLVAPVVVDLERTVGVLKWVTREMDERYKQFSNAAARNIEDFNNHLAPDQERMPYIIVIIDELADLMMLAPDETERVITRIAALARATGIHLVIATQRPSVDVVTGLIKANFPARVAFAVAGGVDSRVILDQPGAERLLGKGDMLYMSGDSPAPVRLQGVWVSDTEINNITRYWKMQAGDEIQSQPITVLAGDDSVKEAPRSVDASAASRLAQQELWRADDDDDDDLNGGDGLDDNDQDELYEQAVEMVRRLNKASVSLLQRRLRIGYTRAARLIDMMEEEGIVGPAQEGSKPREVLSLRD